MNHHHNILRYIGKLGFQILSFYCYHQNIQYKHQELHHIHHICSYSFSKFHLLSQQIHLGMDNQVGY
jgi:hypothetical protein